MSFREYARVYDAFNETKVYSKEISFISKLRGDEFGNVLNIGCGTGQHDRYIRQASKNIVGIEPSFEMYQIAKTVIRTLNISIQLCKMSPSPKNLTRLCVYFM